jgi:hypothetical protein
VIDEKRSDGFCVTHPSVRLDTQAAKDKHLRDAHGAVETPDPNCPHKRLSRADSGQKQWCMDCGGSADRFLTRAES